MNKIVCWQIIVEIDSAHETKKQSREKDEKAIIKMKSYKFGQENVHYYSITSIWQNSIFFAQFDK